MTPVAPASRRTAGKARRTADKAHPRTLLHALARAGFVGYGLLHLAVAWLALQIALGHATEETDQSGAFQLLVREPLGRPLVWIIVVGLAAMALWQVLAATTGYRDEKPKRRIIERIGAGGRVVIYAALAWDAGKTAAGSPTSSSGEQRRTAAGVLAHIEGRVLVAIAGVAVLGAGIGLIVFGVTRTFKKRLHTGQMRPGVRRAAITTGAIGYSAKGVAYGIAGVLLFTAAVHRDPQRSGGLDAALHTLAGKPYGQVLLIIIAAGFAAFGIYCFFQSRYRDV